MHLLALALLAFTAADPTPPPVRALVVTGGHDFDRPQFFAMFESMAGVTWKEATLPEANALYTEEAARDYDVIVFYDMYQEIEEAQKQAFLNLVAEGGKGVVSLHHSLASHQKWPEFHKVIGGRFHFDEAEVDGVKRGKSTFHIGQTLRVKILDPEDPVTKGVKDFEVVDESYAKFDVYPGVKPLLGVDHENSGPVIGWSKMHGKARVVFIQLGHDAAAFSHESYRTLVRNAILWTANRPAK
ncbi:MAG TPA: ThuA domain-containing protein [Candidatus Hydrogenedentes bacterium]|nr:ThuA domain-containing protein [Candidatus Hydrogenedentota bacterium]